MKLSIIGLLLFFIGSAFLVIGTVITEESLFMGISLIVLAGTCHGIFLVLLIRGSDIKCCGYVKNGNK